MAGYEADYFGDEGIDPWYSSHAEHEALAPKLPVFYCQPPAHHSPARYLRPASPAASSQEGFSITFTSAEMQLLLIVLLIWVGILLIKLTSQLSFSTLVAVGDMQAAPAAPAAPVTGGAPPVTRGAPADETDCGCDG